MRGLALLKPALLIKLYYGRSLEKYLVIDIETGIFYKSLKESAIANSMTPNALSCRLYKRKSYNRFMVLK